MRINRGDIYYIQRGGGSAQPSGNEIQKDRPGIVVSAEHLNAGESCVEIVYLTSQPKKEMLEHVQIASSGRVSTAICEQICTASVSRLGNYYGRVTDEEMRQIDKALLRSLGLNLEPKEPEARVMCQDEYITMIEAERNTYKAMYENLLDKVMK